MGKAVSARAELYQEEAILSLGSQKYTTVKATLRLSSSGKTIELASWYADGVGIVMQEQQTNGLQDLRMELLGGP